MAVGRHMCRICLSLSALLPPLPPLLPPRPLMRKSGYLKLGCLARASESEGTIESGWGDKRQNAMSCPFSGAGNGSAAVVPAVAAAVHSPPFFPSSRSVVRLFRQFM